MISLFLLLNYNEMDTEVQHTLRNVEIRFTVHLIFSSFRHMFPIASKIHCWFFRIFNLNQILTLNYFNILRRLKRCHFSFPVSRYRPKLYAFQVLLVLKIPLNSSNMLLYDAKVCQKVYSSWYSRLVSLLFNYLNICPYVRTLLFLVPHIF